MNSSAGCSSFPPLDEPAISRTILEKGTFFNLESKSRSPAFCVYGILLCMSILILTGPAASGKNTISNILAQKRARCAVIDVDMVRWMYRQPHKAPWDGEEGAAQQKFGIVNTCLLAKQFVSKDIDVVILDVVVNDTIGQYKELLPEAKIVLLMPSKAEVRKRFSERPHSISDEEFDLIYQWQEELQGFEAKIDNTNLSAEAAAEELAKFLN